MDAGDVGAVVPAGGAARRMGGTDKALLTVDGTTMLDRVLEAARPVCQRLVVVGPARPSVVEGVRFVQEPEPGGGPVPAVVAGWEALGRPEVSFVLAADLALLTTAALVRLLGTLDHCPGCAAAAAFDDRGKPNPLLAVYRSSATRRWTPRRMTRGAPASVLLPPSVATVDLGARVTLNVNGPDELRRASRLATDAPVNRFWRQ